MFTPYGHENETLIGEVRKWRNSRRMECPQNINTRVEYLTVRYYGVVEYLNMSNISMTRIVRPPNFVLSVLVEGKFFIISSFLTCTILIDIIF